MIRLKPLLEQDMMLPKATATSRGNIMLTDPSTFKQYYFELIVDKLVDISIHVIKVDLKNREITYSHPVSGKHITSDLNQSDIAKITKQYKIEVGDSIENLKTASGDELFLKRIQ